MCGEKHDAITNGYSNPGSPPHVRGKVSNYSYAANNLRITPACAGKSMSTPIYPIMDKDHPRMCGEKRLTLSLKLP